MQAWVLPHVLTWVERQGGDIAALKRLSLPPNLTDPDLRVPESIVEAAWRLAASLTDDTAIGIHVAESVPRGALDLVEYAFRSSASLATGLERLARYSRVLSDRVVARVESSADGLLFIVGDTGTTSLHPSRAEFALAVALRLAREGTGSQLAPLQVSFAHPAPEFAREHARFFGGPVRFDAGSHSMLIRAEDAVRPMQADDALAAIIRRRLEKVLTTSQRQATVPLSGRVREILIDGLGDTTMTPDAVARTLGLSRRTLSRRLAEDGTSFSSILDGVRREFACALLQDHSLSVGDIAFFLQYSEPAAFNRSFRRWTGQTPGAFRNGASPADLRPATAGT